MFTFDMYFPFPLVIGLMIVSAVGGLIREHTTGAKPTSITAIKNYIGADVQIEFFNKLGLRTPKWLQLKGRI